MADAQILDSEAEALKGAAIWKKREKEVPAIKKKAEKVVKKLEAAAKLDAEALIEDKKADEEYEFVKQPYIGIGPHYNIRRKKAIA